MDFLDRINTEKPLNIATAYEIGMNVPENIFLDTLSPKAIEDIVNSFDWEIRDDIRLAIRRVNGYTVTFNKHWNGKQYTSRTGLGSINNNYLLPGDQGLILPSNCSTLFFGSSEKIDKYFDNLIPILQKNAHEGFVNIEVTFQGKEPYYQNIWFGSTVVFIESLCRLMEKPIESILDPLEQPVRGFTATSRIYAYPYDSRLNATVIDSLANKPDIMWDYDSYVVFGKGNNIKQAWRNVYNQCEPLVKYGICYRNDGDVYARRVFFHLKKEHII